MYIYVYIYIYICIHVCIIFAHQMDSQVLDAIPFEKDVDGFHPMNLGYRQTPPRCIYTYLYIYT